MENPFKKEYFSNIPEENVEQVYRNPRLKLPFDPKDLVMFLDRDAEGTPEENVRRLRTIPYHHRSADLGITTPINEWFPSKDGEPGIHHVYTQFDIKGGGFVFPEEHESKKHGLEKGGLEGAEEVLFVPHSLETSYGYDFLGLMDRDMAMFTKEAAKNLAKHGMRTEAIAGIYDINSVKVKGREVPVEELIQTAAERLKSLAVQAKESGDKRAYREYKAKYAHLVSGSYQPAVEVRCMRSVLRIRDLKDAPKEYRQEMIAEVVKSLNIEMQSLDKEERFDAKTPEGRREWLEFITYWMGKDVGIMHGQGMVHSFLHMGNLTLAGEVIDLDSVQKIIKTGKGENKECQDQDFYKQTEDGYACIIPGKGELTKADPKYGLPKVILKDMRDVCFAFKMLLKKFPELRAEVNRKSLAEKMLEGYSAGLGEASPFSVIGIEREELINVMERIAIRLIKDNKPFPSYQKELGIH